MKWNLWVVCCLVCMTSVADAQSTTQSPTPPGFTLNDAVSVMLTGHPLLMAAQANTRASEADVTTAGLWTNPVLTVSYMRSAGFTTYHPVLGVPQVVVSQFVEVANVPGARQHVAQANREAVKADGDAVRMGLVFDVRAAGVLMAEAQARRAVMQEAVHDLAHASDVVRARFGAGAAPHYDLSRVTIAVADAVAALNDAEADLASARGALNVAVGPQSTSLQGDVLFDLLEQVALPSQAELLSEMQAQRPDLQAAQQRLMAARAQVDVARRSVASGFTLFGGVTLGAGTGQAGVAGQTGYEMQVDLTLGVSVPLPVIDRGQGAVPASERRVDASQQVSMALELAASQQLEAAYREVQLRRATLDAYRATGATEAMDMRHEAEAGYREGRLSILELVDAYTSHRDARLRLIALAADARRAEVLLGRIVGVWKR